MSMHCETAFLHDTRNWMVVSHDQMVRPFKGSNLFRSIFEVLVDKYPNIHRRDVTKISRAVAIQVCSSLERTAIERSNSTFSTDLIGDYVAECLFNESRYLAAKAFILRHFCEKQ